MILVLTSFLPSPSYLTYALFFHLHLIHHPKRMSLMAMPLPPTMRLLLPYIMKPTTWQVTLLALPSLINLLLSFLPPYGKPFLKMTTSTLSSGPWI
jgi:hypothetical protein